MRTMMKVMLAAGASMALAGGAIAADKAIVHVAEIPLGGGKVATVRYVGDVPPRISIVPVDQVALPVALIDPNFTAFDDMVAQMDAQRDAMLRQVAALAHAPVMNKMPAGSVRYSFVSSTGADGCTRTVQTSYTAGQPQPQVVRQQSAGCKDTDRAPTPVSAPAATSPTKLVPVKAPAPTAKPFDPKTI